MACLLWNYEWRLKLLCLFIYCGIRAGFFSSAEPLICNLRSLEYLDLSNNQLHGPIPPCLANSSSSLLVLNLQKNNFSGTIPQTIAGPALKTLDLSQNDLEGALPRSLNACRDLEVVNVGHNRLYDVFPSWLEDLPSLKVLVLRYNRFHGAIGNPMGKSSFSSLHIIDLSHNDFTSTLPSEYFESWKAMIAAETETQLNYMGSSYYFDSVIIMNKGLEMTFVRILTTLRAIDLSYNNFHGEIPRSIGGFKSLIVLNLSGNHLTGHIPVSLANLTHLESLDLSQNQLSGEIPRQLASLTFLEVLDLSYNKLTGPIPRGGQFETFANSRFEGNPGLFGFPQSKKTGADDGQGSPTSESESEHRFREEALYGWKAVMMGYGCGVVFGMAGGSWLWWRREEWIETIFNVKVGKQMRLRLDTTWNY